MAVGHVTVARLEGNYLGVNWANVSFWRQITAGCADETVTLWNLLDSSIADETATFANDQVNFLSLHTTNIDAPSFDINQPPTTIVGQRVTTENEPAPSFIAASIRFNRFGAGSRYSYKRIVGLLESDFDGNALVSPATTLLNAIGSAYSENLSSGGCTWEPVQVASGWTLGVPPTVNGVIQAQNGLFLSTQNTRKP